MLTGRHLTLEPTAIANLRQHSVERSLRPCEESSPEAICSTTKQESERVFQALSQAQANVALLNDAPDETDVRIREKNEKLSESPWRT